MSDADRALAPVVGKALEVGVVLLYVSIVAAALYGGVVPEYRATAGDAVADRVLSAAALGVEGSVPATGRSVDARVRVELPDTIRGEAYAVRAVGGDLVLDHPNPTVDGRRRLLLPASVVAVRGQWHSDRPAVVAVSGGPRGVTVELEVGDR